MATTTMWLAQKFAFTLHRQIDIDVKLNSNASSFYSKEKKIEKTSGKFRRKCAEVDKLFNASTCLLA
jgi:hypothetical protein